MALRVCMPGVHAGGNMHEGVCGTDVHGRVVCVAGGMHGKG